MSRPDFKISAITYKVWDDLRNAIFNHRESELLKYMAEYLDELMDDDFGSESLNPELRSDL